MQPETGLYKVQYDPVDMDGINFSDEVFFPVSVLVNSYVDKGENIEIICMMEDENTDEIRNLEKLKEEIDQAASRIGFKYSIKIINVSSEEKVENHLKLFESLIGTINDGDRVYVCATYGTKPIPIVEMLALNYAYRVKDDVSVEKVVYGRVYRNNGEKGDRKAQIFDISPLFTMNQIVNHLAEQRVRNPEKAIRMLLGSGE